MHRRTFLAGTLLAAGGAAAGLWRGRGGWLAALEPSPGAGPGASADAGEPLPDGRRLVRGAGLAFGTTVSIAAVHADPAVARAAIAAALGRIQFVDRLMTVYRPESEVGRLNASGALAHPDPHLVRVLAFAQRLAEASDGAFDVTVQPLWTCHATAKARGETPSPAELDAARALVGWRGLEVSARRVRLARPGMALTLNGVAQGYAADLALEALRAGGVEDALVDAGEHGAEGERQPGAPWRVGVQHPRDPGAVIAAIPMDGRFLAVSGDYATPFTLDLSSHHVLDPRTGRSPPGPSSVAVAAATGLEADGLTKPMMILEAPAARRLLASFPGAGALWIDKAGRVTDAVRLPLGSPG